MTSYEKQLTELSVKIYIMGITNETNDLKSDIEKIFGNWTRNDKLL